MTGPVRLALLFGGRSGEHAVSIVSAESVLAGLAQTPHQVTPVGIERDGGWIVPCTPDQLRSDRPPPAQSAPAAARELVSGCDIVFPLLHGTYGEDGTVQGLLEMSGIAYVGSGVLGSAAGMDKAVMKSVFERSGLKTAPWRLVRRTEWQNDRVGILQGLIGALGLPQFVKPANLGSSVGISKADGRESLAAAIDLAAAYDTRIVCEKAVPDAREIEIAVLGNHEPEISVAGEVFPAREFYDYAAKYEDSASRTQAPADLDPAPPRAGGAAARRAVVGGGVGGRGGGGGGGG
ncbi:MAG: D-alanine--D-alanine ligase, partial [Chloroflexota bacterium]|nr:D-alanine--D-alanine ligase [Chloroflexota bacterium]